VEIIFIWS